LWRGHTIALRRSGEPQAPIKVILIHGFGASSAHWRHTLPALADGAEVIALDLLGFGASAKPRSRLVDEPDQPGTVRYCFDLWAEQVMDAALDLLAIGSGGGTLHLVGNSIGGVVALNAARLLRDRGIPPAQVVLLDCAQRALDDKRLGEFPSWQRPSRPLLKALVRQRAVIAPLFRLLARPAFIRRVLEQAYPSGAHVDDELVELLFRPSTEVGALESFRGFVNLFNDHLAPQLLEELSRSSDAGEKPIPVRLIWGEADPWENPGEARRWAVRYSCIEELVMLPGVGHCPHDEAPELVNPLLRRWLGCSPPSAQRA
jgi:pimeloyl-ACP methyl ester carboxylesterase